MAANGSNRAVAGSPSSSSITRTRWTDLAQAVHAGMTIVYINTELRLAWRRGLKDAVTREPKALPPQRILTKPPRGINVVRSRLGLFQGNEARGGSPPRSGLRTDARAVAYAPDRTAGGADGWCLARNAALSRSSP